MTASDDRIARVRALVAQEPEATPALPGLSSWLHRLCRAAVRAVPVSGAGVSVLTQEGAGMVAAASDARSEELEELQFTLGEGPCLDAFAARRPALEPDLGRPGFARWPAYGPAARAVGVRAVFAFPLQVGASRLGVLDLYRDTPGSLLPDALSLSLGLAEVAVWTLLDGQERTGPGHVPADLDRALDSHVAVYQAQGMLMVDLNIPLVDALARMRGYAYAHDLPLSAVAADIVAGTLRLPRDDPGGTLDEQLD